MNSVILQPCADPNAFDHFNHTIVSDVPTRNIRKFVSGKEWKSIRQFYPDGICRVWGVEPKTGVNIKKWQRIRQGDIAFFSRHKAFIATGTVTLTLQNEQLARFLWEETENKSTWEYIYFLKDVQPMASPVADFNVAVGYKPNYPIQGFSVLDGLQSELAFTYFGLEPLMDTEFITARTAILEKKLAALRQTDKKVLEYQRKEQDLLTAILHDGKKTNTCAFCQRSFPVSFLITAHIKQRSHCSHEERIDRRIVMPLCNMGCDQLYERGYLCVRNGRIIALRKMPGTDPMREYVKGVIGNDCLYFTDQTRLYFEWHLDFHERRLRLGKYR